MPFAAPTMLDEEEKKKQAEGGVSVSGASTSFATNVPGQEPSAQSGSRQKSSGQYANIQSYLDANKTQADGMGQKIAGEVSNKAEDATQKIKTFETQAPTVQAYDPNSAIQKATSLSDQEKAQYKQMKQTGGYSGPQTVDQAQGYQETTKAAQGAHQDVQNAGNEYGQQQLLKQSYARPKYTAGENRLDQVLLQNSAGSKQALEGLSNKYASLDQMLSGATSKVGDAINQANTQALANKNAFIPAEQTAVKGLLEPIKQRADQANANNNDFINRVTGDVSDDVLSDETLQALGLSDGLGIYDLNLSSYLSQDRSQVGIDNMATTDERAKYAALAALFDDPTMSQITANGRAITPVKLDKERFDKDLTGKKTEYETQRNNINNEINANRDNYMNALLNEAAAEWGVSRETVLANPRMYFNDDPFATAQARAEADRAARLGQIDQTYKSTRRIKRG